MARSAHQADASAQARTLADAMAALGKPISHTQALTVLAKLDGRKNRHETTMAAPAPLANDGPLPRPFPVPRNVALATNLGGEDFDAWFAGHMAAAFPGERDIDAIPAGATFEITTPRGPAGIFRALKPILPATLQALAKPLFDYTSKKSEMRVTNEHLGSDYSQECAATETLQALLRHLYEQLFIEPADRVNLHVDMEAGCRISAYLTDSNHAARFHYEHGMDDHDIAHPPSPAEIEIPETTVTGTLVSMPWTSGMSRSGKIKTDAGTVLDFHVHDSNAHDVNTLHAVHIGDRVSLTGRQQPDRFLVDSASAPGYRHLTVTGILEELRPASADEPGIPLDGGRRNADHCQTGLLRAGDTDGQTVTLDLMDARDWSVKAIVAGTTGHRIEAEGILHGTVLTVTYAKAA